MLWANLHNFYKELSWEEACRPLALLPEVKLSTRKRRRTTSRPWMVGHSPTLLVVQTLSSRR